MRRFLVERYLLSAVVPYMLFALCLLTVLLAVQQSARFAEILRDHQASLELIVPILRTLLPGVLVFTLPTSLLIGVLVGVGSLNANSEIVAIKASGTGKAKLMWTFAALGAVTACISLYTGFHVAPNAARDLRAVVVEAARERFRTPIAPGMFETGVPNKVIYARGGDYERGEWQKVFIRDEAEAARPRLITARSGRVDYTEAGDVVELVLADARVITLPDANANSEANSKTNGRENLRDGIAQSGQIENPLVVERLAHLRVRFDIGIQKLLARFNAHAPEMEELGASELRRVARDAQTNASRISAEVVLYRRLALCVAPLFFAILGGSIATRANRHGRGANLLYAVTTLLLYYFLTLGGEQLARSGALAPFAAMSLATLAVLAASTVLLITGETSFSFRRQLLPDKLRIGSDQRQSHAASYKAASYKNASNTALYETRFWRGLSLTSILDRSLGLSIIKSFSLTLVCLLALLMVFTVFDLWRFIAANDVPATTLLVYLFYLQPFLFLALAPVALFVAVLVTYSQLVYKREATSWFAAGQSAYRLAVIAFLLAGALGYAVHLMQERIAPQSNLRQDELREFIKSGTARTETSNQRWLSEKADSEKAAPARIYSYQSTSDNEDGSSSLLNNPVIYEFDDQATHLASISVAAKAQIATDGLRLEQATTYAFAPKTETRSLMLKFLSIKDSESLFIKPMLNKLTHYTSSELKRRLLSARGSEDAAVAVALSRRQSKVIEPLVLIMVAVPLAFACGRFGRMAALSLAILTGSSFFIFSEACAALANYGVLAAQSAMWIPTLLFGAAGLSFMARLKT